jgi:amino acid permease
VVQYKHVIADELVENRVCFKSDYVDNSWHWSTLFIMLLFLINIFRENHYGGFPQIRTNGTKLLTVSL